MSELIREQLLKDPRIKQAKQLLSEALQDHQKNLKTPKDPHPALADGYQKTIEEYAQLRAGNLYYSLLGSGIGHGALVELADGSIKYDMIGGIGPNFFGHNWPLMLDTQIDASLSDIILQGNLHQNLESVELVKLLCEASNLPHCFISTSGAMANENALKIIFQKKHPAHRIIAFDHCFAGRSLATSQITDKPAYREGLPQTLSVDYIPFYDPLRPQESTQETLQKLKALLDRYPKQHAALCLELVQGEGGLYPGSEQFFKTICSFLKEKSIAIWFDEIQTFARTESLFAFQHYHLEEFVDVVTIGKVSQVCATLFKDEFKPKPGLLSQTFTSSTSAIYASILMIRTLLKENYFGPNGKNRRFHQLFEQQFLRLENKYPGKICGPYGIGAMFSFTPFGGDNKRVTDFAHALFKNGLISFICGSHPTRIRFLLPIGALIESDVSAIVSIVEHTLQEFID